MTPTLWLGGAPTYGRDYRELLRHGITAVVDMRAERHADPAFFDEHDIAHRQYRVPDVTVPDEDVLTDAVDWIAARILEGRVVLIHCAKGRGRSATVLAAYLMDAQGMTFDEVDDLLTVRRPLVKLQDRHRQVLESWIARRREARPGGDADRPVADGRMTAQGGVPSRGRGLARPAGLLVTTAVLLATISAGCGGRATPASPPPLTPSTADADPERATMSPADPGRASRLDRDRCRRRHPDRGRGHRSLRLHR